MPKINGTQASNTYDPRWFIWTIVFLIVAGFSLVGYITVQSYNDTASYYDPIVVHSAARHR